MEERNLELDDDGKIRLKKCGASPDDEGADEDEIVIRVPDFPGLEEEEEENTSEEELLRRSSEREKQNAERKEKAEKLYLEAEDLYQKGELDAAGEKYLDSAAMYGADWRPWFGVVRVQTKDFTEFTGIYDCEQAYDKAFRRMKAEDKQALAEKYVPELSRKADECGKLSEEYNKQDVARRESERAGIVADFYKQMRLLIVFGVLFAAFLIAAISLAPFVRSVPNNSILIPCILCFVAALALFVAVCAFLKRFLTANHRRSQNLRAGTTDAGDKARQYAETEELIRSIIDDMTKE